MTRAGNLFAWQKPPDNESDLMDLGEDWASELPEEELEHLYLRSQQRLQETIEFGNQQESKALAFARLSFVLIAASGIFGDLQIEGNLSPISIVSILALASSVAAGVITFFALQPQRWQTGENIQWLAQWASAGATRRLMMATALEILISGFRSNTQLIRRRGRLLSWLLWAVAVQTIGVVGVQVVNVLVERAPNC